jgi:hypothetical protein
MDLRRSPHSAQMARLDPEAPLTHEKDSLLLARILKYLGDHALATAALVLSALALAGSSYAAFTISGGQIRNHTIDPVKLNPKLIAGNVRAWALVRPDGKLIAGGGGPRSTAGGEPGSYVIRWGVRVTRKCASVATIDPGSSQPTETLNGPIVFGRFTAGYATAYTTGVHRPSLTGVQTFNQQGFPTSLGFDVIVVC